MRKFLFILSFLSSLSAFSHEPEGMSFTDSNRAIETAIEKLHPDRLILTDRTGKNTLEVKYKGESIYLNRSLMLGALNDVYNELSVDLTKEEKVALEETKLSIFSYLSQIIYLLKRSSLL